MRVEQRDQSDRRFDVSLEEGDRLADCPFCGHSAPVLEHTWTASYWLECVGCGAEMHDTGRVGSAESKAAHLASARRVIKKWNRRAA